jgi:hypothetical protein
MFSKTDHILWYKGSLNKYKKTEITSWFFKFRSQWNKTKHQEQEKLEKIYKHIETEQCTFEQPVIKEIRGGVIKIPIIKWKLKHKLPVGYSENSSKKEVGSYKRLH